MKKKICPEVSGSGLGKAGWADRSRQPKRKMLPAAKTGRWRQRRDWRGVGAMVGQDNGLVIGGWAAGQGDGWSRKPPGRATAMAGRGWRLAPPLHVACSARGLQWLPCVRPPQPVYLNYFEKTLGRDKSCPNFRLLKNICHGGRVKGDDNIIFFCKYIKDLIHK